MLKGKKFGIIGGGQMCEAIFAGAVEAGVLDAKDVYITDISQGRLDALKEKYGVTVWHNPADNSGALKIVQECEVVMLAIKPQYSPPVFKVIGGHFTQNQLVISILGGVTLASLEKQMPGAKVIRIMPNTPMLLRQGCAGITGGTHVAEADMALCLELFDAVGASFVLPENLIDCVSSVSGSGVAYVYMFIEAMADGGVEQGLPRDVAMELAARTMVGAGEMALKSGLHPGKLKDNVCSPKGGTIAGVHALERGGFRGTVMDAVQRGRERIAELGKESV